MNELNKLLVIGLGISENMSNPAAKTKLQTKLGFLYHQGYVACTLANQQLTNLEQQQKRGEGIGLSSFQSSIGSVNLKPCTAYFDKYLEQQFQKSLNQKSLSPDQALKMSVDEGAGNCNKSSKHKLRKVTNRAPDELFQNNFRRVKP
jgi:hypothetical protein